MRTDALIEALAADGGPVQPHAPRFWALAGAGLVASAALMVATLGLRPGLGAALADPVVVAKSVLPALLAVLAAAVAFRLSRPTGRGGAAAKAMLAVPLVAALLAAATLATSPPAAWPKLLIGETMVWCITSIPVLSIPVLGALLLALRHGAPVDPRRAGMAAGLSAGAAAALVYSLHCLEDSPLFFAVWYGSGIAIAALAGGAAGARVLRW